jgi:hypothetical protein
MRVHPEVQATFQVTIVKEKQQVGFRVHGYAQ